MPLSDKLLSMDDALARFGRPRSKRVVFTNGCFDVIHRGHVEYLDFARSLGDELVVGLNSDRSVRMLKGEGRPLNPVDDRALVLAALESVTGVVVFDHETPADLIRSLLPDILVKGADYTVAEVVGAVDVERAGGKVVLAPLVPGRSTTNLLEKAKVSR